LLKVRLSILWVFLAVAGYRCTSFIDRGIIDKIITGELAEFQTEGMLLFVAFFWLIPFLMAFITVSIKEEKTNRWANLILGVIFVILNIYHFIEHALIEPTVHQLIIVGSTVIAALLIVWYCWKWPKEIK
jgi:hypothetical protein